MSELSNFSVQVCAEDNIQVIFQTPTSRFRFRVTSDDPPKAGRALIQGPLFGLGDSRWHSARTLDASLPENAAMIAEALAAVDIAKARQEYWEQVEAERLQREAKEAAAEAKERLEGQAGNLAALLKRYMDKERKGNKSSLWHEANHVLIAAGL